MKLQPLGDRVVIKRLSAEEKTTGGIVLPDTAKEKPKQGKVISVGHGRRLENGTVVPIAVKAGDRVLFRSYSGDDLKLNGDELLLMREEDLLALVKD